MKISRIVLGVLLLIIALNAFGGGYYGLSGAKDVPLEWLEGSPFKSYFIPALFLLIVIGGACLLTSILVFIQSRHAISLSIFCGLLLIGWILIQVAIIGYISWMQPAVFISGLVILVLARILRVS